MAHQQSRAARHSLSPEIDQTLWQKAQALHGNLLTIDTHADTPLVYLKQPFDLTMRQAQGHLDIARMREGKLRVQFFAAYTPTRFSMGEGALHFGMRMLDIIHHMIESHPQDFALAYSSADIRRLAESDKIVLAIGMENGEPIEGNLANLRNFYRLGVRYLTLTHWLNNHLGDSSTDAEPLWNGLSDFGKEVVQECNHLGIMIDVSHVHDTVVDACLDLSRAPLLASHSNAHALCDHPRNLSDDLIKRIAAAGGVIQVNFSNDFLSQPHCNHSRRYEAEEQRLKQELDNSEEVVILMKEWLAQNPPPAPPPIDIIIEHIEHIVNLTGSVEHVGFGSDFDGIKYTPAGLEDVSAIPKLTYHLLKRGFSEKDIQKIWGENLLRVMASAEQAAGR
ncbi:membrane dipeptidase [candidate division KSB1 bacterium]|nr:MAG: membrane dipeptidase [candidate division KSB1 bacterium]